MTNEIDAGCLRLFAQVNESIARATWALLNGDVELAEAVIEADRALDGDVEALETLIWTRLDTEAKGPGLLRHLFGTLMLLSELERSADLAEHVAQRARQGLGTEMTPVARGIVQRMSEVAIEMWRLVADAYAEGSARSIELHEADEELDILHDRLTAEVAHGAMEPSVVSQVTLVARFYERLGDHAVNLSRRIAAFGS